MMMEIITILYMINDNNFTIYLVSHNMSLCVFDCGWQIIAFVFDIKNDK